MDSKTKKLIEVQEYVQNQLNLTPTQETKLLILIKDLAKL